MKDTYTVEKTREQLSVLAAHLDTQRDSILHRWRTVAQSSPELTIATSLTRTQFNNHIPGVLDALTSKLRTWPDEATTKAQQDEKHQVTEHGLQRWQQGYQLPELLREWGYLQRCLMEELEEYAVAHPDLETPVMPAARRALTELCGHGITDSTTQYWRLQQAEAAGHVRDLEHALSTLNELERGRAEAWREAAHDLRGSVGVVTNAATLIDSDYVPAEMRPQFSEILKRSIVSLHEMLNDLMSLARLEAGHEQLQVSACDAAVLLADFGTSLLPLAHGKGLFLKFEGPASLPVEGDLAKIQRILQNLVLNALKYTQRGGVTVIWGEGEGSDSRSWMFCVQDTGPGLDDGPGAPLARQLYEATQVVHEEVADSKVAYAEVAQEEDGHGADVANAPTVPAQTQISAVSQLPGEGVGLSIVKRLCELLEASLELETSPGRGSTFRVTLPRCYDNRAH
jgi:signal transduction histidine kinase